MSTRAGGRVFRAMFAEARHECLGWIATRHVFRAMFEEARRERLGLVDRRKG